MDSNKATFVTLKNHASAPITKERSSPSSKAKTKAKQNKFVEKSGVPDKNKSFREIDCSKNRPRAILWFVKPIQNALRKKENLI